MNEYSRIACFSDDELDEKQKRSKTLAENGMRTKKYDMHNVALQIARIYNFISK